MLNKNTSNKPFALNRNLEFLSKQHQAWNKIVAKFVFNGNQVIPNFYKDLEIHALWII